MTSTLINLSGHSITYQPSSGTSLVIPAAKAPAKVTKIYTSRAPINGIPIANVTYSKVTNLPDAVADTYLIVDHLVKAVETTRTDLITPDLGDSAITSNNTIVAITRFLI